jgi:hypothetical protein
VRRVQIPVLPQKKETRPQQKKGIEKREGNPRGRGSRHPGRGDAILPEKPLK